MYQTQPANGPTGTSTQVPVTNVRRTRTTLSAQGRRALEDWVADKKTWILERAPSQRAISDACFGALGFNPGTAQLASAMEVMGIREEYKLARKRLKGVRQQKNTQRVSPHLAREIVRIMERLHMVPAPETDLLAKQGIYPSQGAASSIPGRGPTMPSVADSVTDRMIGGLQGQGQPRTQAGQYQSGV